MIAESLAGVCNGGSFSISALKPGEEYPGPTKEVATACRCSSVYYSVLSACAICQDVDATILRFPPGIPPGTPVPHYAFEDVTLNDVFNILTAEADIGEPESSALPTSTRVGSSGPSSSAQPSGNKNKSNTGISAGGVVGGVVFLAAIAGLAFWWGRRRRAPHAHTSTPNSASSGHVAPMSYNYTSSTAPRIYVPPNPFIFPSANPSSGSLRTVQSTGQESFVNPAMAGATHSASRTGYSGMPEI
ncbi:hypothetical protein BD779DRAFT_1786660 [Infundibulicybe gibba]|nr:hypothetical protein BD779DRAFT_1786660 [Infundibulicybe gibba]